jgi:hypothetical protein
MSIDARINRLMPVLSAKERGSFVLVVSFGTYHALHTRRCYQYERVGCD